MRNKNPNPKFQFLFPDRVGIIFDIAQMVTEKDLNIVSMEVIQNKKIAEVYIEIDQKNMLIDRTDMPDIFKKLPGILQVNVIKTLPQEKREQRFRVLIDGVSDGIISVEDNYKISTINSVACSILDVNEEDVIGKKIEDAIPNDCVLKESLEKKIPVTRRRSIVTSRGRIEFFASSKPITDSTGNFVGAVAILKNLNEIKDIAEAVKKPIPVTFDSIAGKSDVMETLKSFAIKIAKSDNIISIRGLSGTGKELFARAIHFEKGDNGPFVPVNCAAMPEPLLESELFGYVAGAFTGAKKKGKPGLFEVAENGTIFLDEIGDMPLGLQAKILRVLQEKTLRRIGGTEEICVNAGIITATNKKLEEMVQEKTFREDLYYRINVLPFHIPPLRERMEDTPLLADLFLFNINSKFIKKSQALSPGAMEKLKKHSWPGNVRELKNVIERASIIADSDLIGSESILFSHEMNGLAGSIKTEKMFSKNTGNSLKERLSEYEKDIIVKTMKKNSSIRQSAKYLGISHTTLLNKIKKHDLTGN
ncbi:MAG: sigma 54-interacting transcriptional regulator [Thermodesulfobacteriota bacterium]|nr:sigma 54-interacting transcriptional regulator [Thermodesulfobacteriota bacterium]